MRPHCSFIVLGLSASESPIIQSVGYSLLNKSLIPPMEPIRLVAS